MKFIADNKVKFLCASFLSLSMRELRTKARHLLILCKKIELLRARENNGKCSRRWEETADGENAQKKEEKNRNRLKQNRTKQWRRLTDTQTFVTPDKTNCLFVLHTLLCLRCVLCSLTAKSIGCEVNNRQVFYTWKMSERKRKCLNKFFMNKIIKFIALCMKCNVHFYSSVCCTVALKSNMFQDSNRFVESLWRTREKLIHLKLSSLSNFQSFCGTKS